MGSAAGKHSAVSIPTVRDATGAKFGVWALDRVPFPFVTPLVCGECGAAAKAVPSHTVRRSGTSFARRGYYSLVNRENDDHRRGCEYAFDRRVGEIVQDFAHEVDRVGDTVVLLLRTHARRRGREDGDPPPSTTKRLQIHAPSQWEPSPATVQAAASIASLLRAFHDDPAAAARFRVSWQGTDIAWTDFCYDTTNDLHDALDRAHGDHSPHPIAVYGAVANPCAPSSTRKSWRIYLTPIGSPVPVSLRANTNDRNLIDYSVGTHVLGYGLWKQFPRGSSHELTLWCSTTAHSTAC